MTEADREVPSSAGVQEAQRTLHFREVRGVALRPGDLIVGIETLDQLDGLLDTIAVNLTRMALNTSSRVVPLSDSFRRDGARVGCFGAVRDFSVVVCPTQPDNGLMLEVTGMLSSTKKKDLSPIRREATVFVAPSGNPKLDSRLVNEQELRRNVRVAFASRLAAVDPSYIGRVKRIR